MGVPRRGNGSVLSNDQKEDAKRGKLLAVRGGRTWNGGQGWGDLRAVLSSRESVPVREAASFTRTQSSAEGEGEDVLNRAVGGWEGLPICRVVNRFKL
jgi:hypothetical protein